LQACFKAWEYHGYVNEKEASYKDAAINYERAWQFSNYTNPTIGNLLFVNFDRATLVYHA
jgi:tetratricopeptide repeat protein 21B